MCRHRAAGAAENELCDSDCERGPLSLHHFIYMLSVTCLNLNIGQRSEHSLGDIKFLSSVLTFVCVYEEQNPQVKDPPSSAACSVWWLRRRTCSTRLRTWWPSSWSSTSSACPQSAPTPFFTDFSMRISKRWQKIGVEGIGCRPNKQRQKAQWTQGIESLNYIDYINPIQYTGACQAFMDCHFQW